METLDHLNAAIDEDFFDQDTYETFRNEWQEVRNVLNGYIRYLQSLTPKDKRFMI